MDPSRTQVATQSLAALADGDASAAEQLTPVLYDELRELAGKLFRHQRPDQTLQPTALVHEVYLRLIDQTATNQRSRAHFMALAARAMRQILADHARRRKSAKRGGNWQRVLLEPGMSADPGRALDAVDLDAALTELAALDERKYRVVELRFFASMTVDEVAAALDLSRTTVEGDWRMARAWLMSQLS